MSCHCHPDYHHLGVHAPTHDSPRTEGPVAVAAGSGKTPVRGTNLSGGSNVPDAGAVVTPRDTAPATFLDPDANRLALALLVALVLGVLAGAVVAVWP